jgi:hypothetical protein
MKSRLIHCYCHFLLHFYLQRHPTTSTETLLPCYDSYYLIVFTCSYSQLIVIALNVALSLDLQPCCNDFNLLDCVFYCHFRPCNHAEPNKFFSLKVAAIHCTVLFLKTDRACQSYVFVCTRKRGNRNPLMAK